MRGRHHNIFYYYRGPSKAGAAMDAQEQAHQRQVEDNTTKALVNVLENSEPALTASFLRRFVPGAALDGLDGREYHLQGGPQDPANDKWLLGISVLGELDPRPAAAAPRGGSRIDAAIHLPGSSLALIEVKVVEYLDPHQLVRHAKEWAMPLPPTDVAEWPSEGPWRRARWADIHEWASEASRTVTDPVSRFLVDQLCEYLELTGLASFAGFRDEHFGWLALPAAERSWDIQSEIKANLRSMWEAIFERLQTEEVEQLGEIHVNQLPLDATVAAAQTNWGESGANITIELTPAELQLNVVGWKVPQAALLESWLAPDGHIRSDLKDTDLELAVFRRKPYNYAQKGTGKKAWWQKEHFELAERRPLADLAGSAFEELTARWRVDRDPGWEHLAYHVRRAWPRATASEDGDALVPDLVKTVQVLVPLLAQINPPAKATKAKPQGALLLDAVPAVDAPWEHINEFAHTFDGYSHFGDAWSERVRRASERFFDTGELPNSIDDLRGCLFCEFRMDRFTWGDDVTLSDPDNDGVRHVVANPGFERSPTQRYRRAIVGRIRELVAEAETGRQQTDRRSR